MAISKITHRVNSLTPGVVTLFGSFFPQGTSAPVAGEGKGFTATRTGVGTYLLTFDDTLIGITPIVSIQEASAADTTVTVGDYTAASKTLQIRIYEAGSAADPAADANASVNFVVFARNSTVN